MSSNYNSISEFSSKINTTWDSGSPPEDGKNTTDIIYQPVKLYIEGVEVPFVNISISQAMGELPYCEIEIPPHVGLMDIVRYYQPKVHVFYTDLNIGGDRLLFWGQIVATAYSKSRAGSGFSSIRFRCRHRNSLGRSILLSFASQLGTAAGDSSTTTDVGYTNMDSFNSLSSLTMAMKGITGVQTEDKDLLSPLNDKVADADVTKLPAEFAQFENRLIGMPAITVNLWNQLKRVACRNPEMRLNLLAMYIPLFEQGLSYLKRMSGHYVLESEQHLSKIPYCPDKAEGGNIMIPPSYRTGSTSAINVEMATKAIQEGASFSGEMTDFISLCENFYSSIEYEMITLASPAEVSLDPTLDLGERGKEVVSVETIIKPQIPFYYSPICNVVFPRMFDSISIDQNEENVPTRMMAIHQSLPTATSAMTANYRAPHAYRESQALGNTLKKTTPSTKAESDKIQDEYSLRATTDIEYNIPGKYEQGVGIRATRTVLPWWLTLLAKDKSQQGDAARQETWPKKSEQEYQNLLVHTAAWNSQYGINTQWSDEGLPSSVDNPAKHKLNPYNPVANIFPHERVLFSGLDYEFSKKIAQSRQGSVSMVFNPYIVPGYPMDILDDSPWNPSFHGMCVAVNHTITARSINTTASIAAAITYTELANYYHPPLHPWLQTTLKMVNATVGDPSTGENSQYGDVSGVKDVSNTLLQNPIAKGVADDFYYSVLGVGAADPTTLYDYSVERPIPQFRMPEGATLEANANSDSIPLPNGGEGNDWLTTVGNLRLVSRRIESKSSISSAFGYNFIDWSESNYSGGVIEYTNPTMNYDKLFDCGASMFLEYMETKDFINSEKLKVKS